MSANRECKQRDVWGKSGEVHRNHQSHNRQQRRNSARKPFRIRNQVPRQLSLRNPRHNQHHSLSRIRLSRNSIERPANRIQLGQYNSIHSPSLYSPRRQHITSMYESLK
jgi:hypothetical protein